MKETKLIAIAMGLVFISVNICFVGIMFDIPKSFGIFERVAAWFALGFALVGINITIWLILKHMWRDFK